MNFMDPQLRPVLDKNSIIIPGGSGGGKPDSAMGGGKDPLMLDNALAVVDNFVSEHVKK